MSIGEGLTALAKKAAKGFSFDRFLPALKSYCHQQINHLQANGLEDAVTILEDKEAAIDACFAEFGHECKSISEFTDRMLDLFAEDIHGMIILSTIHRAKGDQAKELIREFYLEYTPQVGDKVRKKGLYGWDGDVLQVDQEKSLILWYGCGKIPDPLYPLWEDNNNLILASWRNY